MAERAVLLVNLGSPDSYATRDVRRYLDEFLMDGRVIDLPWPLRRLIVSAFVLPKRPPQTAQAYRSIWLDEGAPLKVYTDRLARALDRRLEAPVRWAMRYGTPAIAPTLATLAADGVREVRLLPLYPHYAMSTVETTVVEAQRAIAQRGLPLTLTVAPVFYDDDGYVDALATVTGRHMPADCDHLLMSYHGLPERHLKRTDPTGGHCLRGADCCEQPSPAHARCYRHQVRVTSQKLAQKLELEPTQWSLSFQSRLGSAKWLQPYTDEVIAALPAQGVRRLAVVCPAFVADNLETLEEIGIQGRETFLAAGGESFTRIPCLNDDPAWVDALADLLQRTPDETAPDATAQGAAQG